MRFTNPVLDSIIATVKSISPFSMLGDERLRAVMQHAAEEFYPSGRIISGDGAPRHENLSIISQGSVRITLRTDNGKTVHEQRGAGEFFGSHTLLTGSRTAETVVATEDTSCFLIDLGMIARLMKDDREFAESLQRVHAGLFPCLVETAD